MQTTNIKLLISRILAQEFGPSLIPVLLKALGELGWIIEPDDHGAVTEVDDSDDVTRELLRLADALEVELPAETSEDSSARSIPIWASILIPFVLRLLERCVE